MKNSFHFSACVTSAILAGVAFSSCNKDDIIEPDPEQPAVTPQEPFDGVRVYEYMPAPGQYINETVSMGNLASQTAANQWAEDRLNSNRFVSLGSFGGYIVVGLDHSIEAGNGDYDFYVAGNAFNSEMGGSNEPGIVWVMEDSNGNRLPDDRWYELAGCESFAPETRRGYSVTYYRPAAPGEDTPWRDSDGQTGVVAYLAQFHKQDYYYPLWVKSDSCTFTGTLLSPKNSQNQETGFWNNEAYEWGYSDNVGSDNIDGKIQRTGFKIANAVNPDGSKAKLEKIDFVKIQTGVLAGSGILGEVSTEVCGFGEYPVED